MGDVWLFRILSLLILFCVFGTLSLGVLMMKGKRVLKYHKTFALTSLILAIINVVLIFWKM